jgi:hypothetical protein
MKNNLLLNLHCFFSNLLGILVLIYAGASFVMMFDQVATMRTLLFLLHILFLGLLLLGVSQFLRHVSGQTDRPGWILRRGEFIIYFAIIVTIFGVIWQLSTLGADYPNGMSSLPTMSQAISIIFSGTRVFAKVLIMFGIAQSLRRMGYSFQTSAS